MVKSRKKMAKRRHKLSGLKKRKPVRFRLRGKPARRIRKHPHRVVKRVVRGRASKPPIQTKSGKVKLKLLIQELDESGHRSLRGECFTVIGSFEEVVQRIKNMLLEGFAACLSSRGRLLFIPYSESGVDNLKCPFCNAVIGFDPHDSRCPLHKMTVAKWLNQNLD
jgi:hypothetical protein